MTKTIESMNGKTWYRAVKAMYIVFFIFILIAILIAKYVEAKEIYTFPYRIEEAFYGFLPYIIGVSIIFEIIKRTFYYVVFNTIKPK
jgi:hypothetical protein